MARVYYLEEKLTGEPITESAIDVKLFDYIFDNTDTYQFQLEHLEKSSFFGLVKSKVEVFKNARLIRDGFHYNTKEGNFFLPISIIFCDNFDYSYPSEYYFIAKIGNQIELRGCHGGKGVQWFQTPTMHQPVNSSKILQKIEATLFQVKNLVETTHHKKWDIENKKKEEEEKKKHELNRSQIGSIQKEAYSQLVELFVNDASQKAAILDFIAKLKNYDNDKEYYSTLNFFLEHLEKNKVNFVMRLDWKAEIEDLKWSLENNLKQFHGLKLKLTDSKKYSDETTVSSEDVFKDFDTSLREHALQMGFIDTKSDEYLLLIHKIKSKDLVEKSINKMGYGYYETFNH